MTIGVVSITVDGVAYDVPSSAANSNWAALQVLFEQALAAGVNEALASLSWTAVSYTNGWEDNPGHQAGETAIKAGVVYVRCGCQSGTSGTSAFTLATDRRPPALLYFPVLANNGTQLASVVVNTNGTVVITDIGGSDVGAGVDFAFSFAV